MAHIERTVDGHQVVATFGVDDTFDSVVWGMISHNQVPHVAPASRSTIDATTVVRYDVAGSVPLVGLVDRPLRREQVLALVSGVLETLLEADRYMIDQHAFLVTREHLYVDPSSCEPVLLCLPVREREPDDVATVLRDALLQLWIDREEDRAYVAELVNVLTAAGSGADLRVLARAVKDIEAPRKQVASPFGDPRTVEPAGGREGPAAPHASAAPGAGAPASYGYAVPGAPSSTPPVPAPAAPASPGSDGEKKMSLLYLLQHYSKENKEIYDRQRKARAAAASAASAAQAHAAQAHGAQAAVAPGVPPAPPAVTHTAPVAASAPASLPADARGAVADTPFEHTIHVGARGVREEVPDEVQAAVAAGTGRARLQRTSTGEMILLTQAVTVIGRRRARVDVAISGDTVSKNHATVIRSAQGWSITDNGSTNGVEIGGQRIAAFEPVMLSSGDRIGIGDEVLIFMADA